MGEGERSDRARNGGVVEGGFRGHICVMATQCT